MSIHTYRLYSPIYEDCDENRVCRYPQDLFKESEINSLRNAYFDIGVLAFAIGMIVTFCILRSDKLSGLSRYQNLLPLFTAVTFRRSTYTVANTLTIGYLFEFMNQFISLCKLLGFIDTFLSVFEIESLTHLCIERFINAYYTQQGWPVPDWHNTLFFSISFGLACLYSILPIIGIGVGYGKDFDCKHCTMDLKLPENGILANMFIALFALMYFKPFLVMFGSIVYTKYLEAYKLKKYDEYQATFTDAVMVMAMVSFGFWVPLISIRYGVIHNQIMFDSMAFFFTPYLVKTALVMNYVAPVLGIGVFALKDSPLAAKVMNLFWDRPDEEDLRRQGRLRRN
ncbi:uncharacterized protein LOC135087696 [Ostrinia nubilalis]|uniref:uncharacterized protein LOC135087696 n=1 Tax=Ostrinia nubilalis TaxID=29057 RepID=UPI0030822791